MAIQGTQVPMYIKHTLFLYFSDFSIFLYEKQNKAKLKNNHTKTCLTKQKHKNQMQMHEEEGGEKEINPWREHQCLDEGIQNVCCQEVW